MIIGVGPFVGFSENAYAHAARLTGRRILDTCSRFAYHLFYSSHSGGEYIPLVNADRILSQCLDPATDPCYTLSQRFRHILQKQLEKDSNYLYCPTMHKSHQSDVRDEPLIMREVLRLVNQ